MILAAWKSLRFRLLVSTSLAIAVVLGLLALSVYFSMRHSLLSEFDASLLAQAQTLQAMSEQRGGKVSFEFDPQQLPEFAAASHPEYFQLWLDDGRVLARSDSLGQRQLPHDWLSAQQTYTSRFLPDGRHGRVISFSFTPRVSHHGNPATAAPRGVYLLVARESAVVHHTMSYLSGLLWGLFTAAIVVSGVVLLTVVGRALRPVMRVAEEIGSLRETDLGRRLPTQRVPTELSPVVEKLNGLLIRLEAAFSREKSFTADVAHELRTPLAGLRTTLEVCRSRPRDAAAYESALDECQKMTDRMQAMVESLLLLARAEAGQLTVERQSFDLCPFVADCWEMFDRRARNRHLQIELACPVRCQIQTDPDKLRIVIHNLLDNAVSYANDGGKIAISIDCLNDIAQLRIANTGTLVPAEDIPRLFERFWRGDESRSDTGVHSGLGLSLCKRLLSLLDGQIAIETSRGGEFIARLTVPRRVS